MLRITRSPRGAMADAFLTTATKTAAPVAANAVVPGSGDAMNLFVAAASWKQAANVCMASAGTQAQRDECSKSGWAGEIEYVCGAATVAAGQPEASLLCGPVAGVVAELTYKFAEITMDAMASLIPSSWRAQATFCGSCIADELFTPIPAQWRAAVASVEEAWKAATSAAGMAGKPFAIQHKYLLPVGFDLAVPAGIKFGNQVFLTPEADLEQYETTAEDALLYWLNHAFNGWTTPYYHWWNGPDTHGLAELRSSTEYGSVLDGGGGPCGVNLCSKGPFGAGTGGFPEKCNGGCQSKLVDGVRAFYQQRLAALRRALPAVSGGIANQVQALKPKFSVIPKLTIVPKLNLAFNKTLTIKPSPAKTLVPSPSAASPSAPSTVPVWAWWAGGGLLAALVVGGVWYARTR